MASSIALRRATTSLFSKPINPIRSASTVSSVSRSFNTDTQVTNFGNDDLGTVNVDRRSSDNRSLSRRRDPPPGFFPLDGIDPFSPTRTLSQVMNLMDHLMDIPSVGAGGYARRGWDVKEDDDALYLRLDMPGLSKEDVKVCVEHDTLVIKGEGPKENEEDEGSGRRYSSRLQLSPIQYKVDEIKAEMKNGVLKVAVPRAKEDERKNVHEVQIE
ncbi:heat-shock protein, putative [Ricinus communis]|uniref:Heat-shock protein, putative n=1 Tax=Ricinus communis TaxID=3988 RepID=B9SSG1_RICCO|nr:heat-shock protein, putative [Ricinus communis]|eukprot:XP_002528930.1 small heat shock protein, chloroplastic [Ricinus communis]